MVGVVVMMSLSKLHSWMCRVRCGIVRVLRLGWGGGGGYGWIVL